MLQADWKKIIVEACKSAGTYKPFFNLVIDTLAGILERRDDAVQAFVKSGGKPIVKHTNKGGGTFLEQNPALRLLNELNRDAMQYWRELGLTPSSLKRINEESLKTMETKHTKTALDVIRAKHKS